MQRRQRRRQQQLSGPAAAASRGTTQEPQQEWGLLGVLGLLAATPLSPVKHVQQLLWALACAVVRPSRMGWSVPLGAAGLGVSVVLIHVYVTPLKRFLQVGGRGGAWRC